MVAEFDECREADWSLRFQTLVTKLPQQRRLLRGCGPLDAGASTVSGEGAGNSTRGRVRSPSLTAPACLVVIRRH